MLLVRSQIAGVSRSIIERPSVYLQSARVKAKQGVRSISYARYRTIRLLKIDFGM